MYVRGEENKKKENEAMGSRSKKQKKWNEYFFCS